MKAMIQAVRSCFLPALMVVCALPGLLSAVPAAAASKSLRDCDVGVYEQLRDETVTPLFEALRAGDVAQISRYLSRRMADEYKVLFEQNSEYGQYLRDYYAGSNFELLDVQGSGGEFSAVVQIYWSDGRSVETELELNNAQGHLRAEVGADTCADLPD